MAQDADIIFAPHNHSHSFIWASESIEREIGQEFSFIPPGAQYMKQFQRSRGWDGRIRLLNRTTKLIYTGLLPRVRVWSESRGYTIDDRLPSTQTGWSALDTQSIINQWPVPMDVRDYQIDGITHALHHQRCVLLSATGSGKSLVLYYIARYRAQTAPVLLIVPSIHLVSQMVSDWRNYGWDDVDQYVHKITAGVDKQTTKPIVVTTYQSVYKQPEKWFARYQTVLGDECHMYRAEALRGIMEKMDHCAYRIGVTGTLDDAKSNRLMVEGVFGLSYQVARTAQLQERGQLSPIQVQGHILKYGQQDKYILREQKRQYPDEIDHFVRHEGRMAWTTDFIKQLPGNVLVLFQFVEKHGLPLYRALSEALGSRPVYYVSGMTEGSDRDKIRTLLEQPEHIVLTFPDGEIRCAPAELVPLSDGTFKPAGELVPTDDIENAWVRATINTLSKLLSGPIGPESTDEGDSNGTMGFGGSGE